MRLFAIMALMSTVLGCSGGSGGSGTAGGAPSKADHLSEVGGLISSYSGEFKKGPSKVADLARYENGYPMGYLAVKNGDIVVIWNVKMVIEEGAAAGQASSSSEIIAHEKACPTEGGNVLYTNGTVKKLTADEFKAAPKAGKK